MELLGQKAVSFLVFRGNSILLSAVAAPVCIPNSVLGYLFSTSSPTPVCWFVYDGHSQWCEVVSHCGFNLHLLMASDAEHLSICLWALYISSLEKSLFKSFTHFLIVLFCLRGVESCEFFVYFGDQTIVRGSIGRYVFPYCWSLFILMLFSLSMQKLFILIRSHFFILSFMSLALGNISMNMLRCGMWESVLPMSSLGLLWCHNLYLSLLSTLNLFLCMV